MSKNPRATEGCDMCHEVIGDFLTSEGLWVCESCANSIIMFNEYGEAPTTIPAKEKEKEEEDEIGHEE